MTMGERVLYNVDRALALDERGRVGSMIDPTYSSLARYIAGMVDPEQPAG